MINWAFKVCNWVLCCCDYIWSVHYNRFSHTEGRSNTENNSGNGTEISRN